MVGYPADVEAVYLEAGGILERAAAGALLIDMTTSSPSLARRISASATAKGLRFLDAPVSGGDLGARNATLSIMVGGSRADFEAAEHIFSLMGKNIVLQGGSGAGQYCKMSNQIAIASNMVGVVEALHFGASAGLDPRTMLKSIESGAAGSWSLSNLVPRIIDGNLSPGFYVKHFVKDIGIALDSAKELGLRLPGLELADKLYRALAGMTRSEMEGAIARLHRATHDGAVAGAPFSADVVNGADLGTQALSILYTAGRV
jgi:3-hydroxyisobutyrate dehydrogenase